MSTISIIACPASCPLNRIFPLFGCCSTCVVCILSLRSSANPSRLFFSLYSLDEFLFKYTTAYVLFIRQRLRMKGPLAVTASKTCKTGVTAAGPSTTGLNAGNADFVSASATDTFHRSVIDRQRSFPTHTTCCNRASNPGPAVNLCGFTIRYYRNTGQAYHCCQSRAVIF